MNFYNKQKGFTLIELLVVISIISLLSTIVMASLNAAREKSRIAAGLKFWSSIHHANYNVGFWAFDDITEPTVDYAGKNNLQITGNPELVNDKRDGKAYYFGGNTGVFLSVAPGVFGPTAQTLQNSNGIILSAWIKTNVNTEQRIISYGHCGWTKGFAMQTNYINYLLELESGIGGGSGDNSIYFQTSGQKLSDNKWHHVMAEFDLITKKAKMFVDGKQSDLQKHYSYNCGQVINQNEYDFSDCNSLDPYASSESLFIGSACARPVNGTIDDPAIYIKP